VPSRFVLVAALDTQLNRAVLPFECCRCR